MESIEEKRLLCPDKFDFPFPPYNIQNDFMRALYETIDNKKYGIFESPTGTVRNLIFEENMKYNNSNFQGKSLSIICGTIRWMKDYTVAQREVLTEILQEYQIQKEKLKEVNSGWLALQSKEIEMNRKLDHIKLKLNKISEYDERITKIFESVKNKLGKEFKFKDRKIKINNTVNELEITENIDDDMLIVDDIVDESDDEDEDNDDEYEPVKVVLL